MTETRIRVRSPLCPLKLPLSSMLWEAPAKVCPSLPVGTDRQCCCCEAADLHDKSGLPKKGHCSLLAVNNL